MMARAFIVNARAFGILVFVVGASVLSSASLWTAQGQTAPLIKITGQYRNRDYAFSVQVPAGLAANSAAPPAPQHGFGIDLSTTGATILVNAEYDAQLKFSVGTIADDLAVDLRRREPGLKLSSRRFVTLDGLDAIESIFDGEPAGSVTHARHVVALRPQSGGVGIVYEIVLEQRTGSRVADETFTRIKESFRMTERARGTSPEGSRLLQKQIAVVGCWATESWAADALRDVGIGIGDFVDVKFGRGHIEGMDGDAVSDADNLQAMLLAPGWKEGLLITGWRKPNGMTEVAGAMTYHLSRGGRHWAAGEGHGGIGTYRAMGHYADYLDRQPATSLPLRPAAPERCAK